MARSTGWPEPGAYRPRVRRRGSTRTAGRPSTISAISSAGGLRPTRAHARNGPVAILSPSRRARPSETTKFTTQLRAARPQHRWHVDAAGTAKIGAARRPAVAPGKPQMKHLSGAGMLHASWQDCQIIEFRVAICSRHGERDVLQEADPKRINLDLDCRRIVGIAYLAPASTLAVGDEGTGGGRRDGTGRGGWL